MHDDDSVGGGEEPRAGQGPEHDPFVEPDAEDPWVAPDSTPERPTQEERVWAAVAHVCGAPSTLLLPIIVSLVIYLVKKETPTGETRLERQRADGEIVPRPRN